MFFLILNKDKSLFIEKKVIFLFLFSAYIFANTYLRNSDDLKIGDDVLAIGNPYGIGISVSNGIISATGRDYGNPYLQLIQTM